MIDSHWSGGFDSRLGETVFGCAGENDNFCVEVVYLSHDYIDLSSWSDELPLWSHEET